MFKTRFVLNNLWEIPPKKGYRNMFQNTSKELFVDISKIVLLVIPEEIMR